MYAGRQRGVETPNLEPNANHLLSWKKEQETSGEIVTQGLAAQEQHLTT
jgi:hypothetical protein